MERWLEVYNHEVIIVIIIIIIIIKLTPWLMKSGGSMSHSQGFSNNSYPEPNQPNSPH